MKALILEKKGDIAIREIEPAEHHPGPDDVKVKISDVGICGSDIHYFLHGRIGDFIVNEPMILGHEASGIIEEIGANVKNLKVGDRVCMEPGIFSCYSREAREGIYNVDPSVKFWATPPVHGCLCEFVIHPAHLTFRLPENVSLEEGALIEPLAIGIHAMKKARIVPGDTAVVFGSGTIGAVTALAALASGCNHVYISDVKQKKLDFISAHYGDRITPFNSQTGDFASFMRTELTNGADVAFETSGSAEVIRSINEYLRPGGRIVFIGMPKDPPQVDIVGAQTKELEMQTLFRYANAYERTLKFVSSGHINVKPLITHRFPFEKGVEAFQYAAGLPEEAVKIMITM